MSDRSVHVVLVIYIGALKNARLTSPIDATCIAASTQHTNKLTASGLLIGSPEGIRYLDPAQATKKDIAGILIKTNTAILKHITSLEVTEDGSHNTLWFTNKSGELGYIRAQENDFSNGQSALLLPANMASSFTVCTAQPSDTNGNVAWQMLIANDRRGNLTLLQQASDTGLWRPEPFYSPSSTENYEIESYTISMKVHSEDGLPLVSGQAFIASASAVDATLNGLRCTLNPDGAWYDIDETGSLDFIVPTQSLGGQSLEIIQLKDQEGNAVALKKSKDSFVYDPSLKPMLKMQSKIAAMKDSKDLAKLAGPSVASEDLNQAFTCLKQLGTAYQGMPRDGTSTLLKGAKRASSIAEATSAQVQDVSMDWWHWLKQKIGGAVNWAVNTAGASRPKFEVRYVADNFHRCCMEVRLRAWW